MWHYVIVEIAVIGILSFIRCHNFFSQGYFFVHSSICLFLTVSLSSDPMDVASNDSQLITFNSVRNSACITIVIPRDDVVESEEFFGLMLWSSDNYVTFKNPRHIVQITDCNSKIIHNFNWKKIA